MPTWPPPLCGSLSLPHRCHWHAARLTILIATLMIVHSTKFRIIVRSTGEIHSLTRQTEHPCFVFSFSLLSLMANVWQSQHTLPLRLSRWLCLLSLTLFCRSNRANSTRKRSLPSPRISCSSVCRVCRHCLQRSSTTDKCTKSTTLGLPIYSIWLQELLGFTNELVIWWKSGVGVHWTPTCGFLATLLSFAAKDHETSTTSRSISFSGLIYFREEGNPAAVLLMMPTTTFFIGSIWGPLV